MDIYSSYTVVNIPVQKSILKFQETLQYYTRLWNLYGKNCRTSLYLHSVSKSNSLNHMQVSHSDNIL